MTHGAFTGAYADQAAPPPPQSLWAVLGGAARREIKAGVGDMKVSNDPEVILSTYSLGSCIGLAAYDPAAKVGGLLHYQLPCSSLASGEGALQTHRFADTGIPALFEACAPGWAPIRAA